MTTEVQPDWEHRRCEVTSQLLAWIPVFFRDLAPSDIHAIQGHINDGKQLRGSLALAVCDALGGDTSRAAPAAVAVECIHTASLMHDDLVDSDCTRRNRPAAWIVHGSRRAVLLADVIFATALERAAELGREEVLTLSRAIAKVAAGAYKEPLDLNELESLTSACAAGEPLYDRIIYLKTGALFEAAAELGAIAAGASLNLRKAAGAFGARTGEAYQVADDLRDVVTPARMPLSPQQEATLASLCAYFDIRMPVSAAGKRLLPDREVEQLSAAMKAEVAKRVALADEALGSLPQGAPANMLRSFPRKILEPIMADAEGALANAERDCERS